MSTAEGLGCAAEVTLACLLGHVRCHVLVLAGVRAHAQDADARTGAPLGNRVDAVGGKLVNLGAAVHFLLLEGAVLQEQKMGK